MGFLVRVLVNAVAIGVTTWLLGGIELIAGDGAADQAVVLLVVALVFGLVNAIVKPVVKVLTFPVYLLTLGLFTLVVNALMLMLTAWITEQTDWGLRVDGFWTAVAGALVISVVSFVLSAALGDRRR